MPRPIDAYNANEAQVAIEEEIDVITEEVSVELSPKLKRHKKHKHKKHKRKKNDSDAFEETIAPPFDSSDLPQSSMERALFEDLKSSFETSEDIEFPQKSGGSANDLQTSSTENKVPGLSPKSSGKKRRKEKDGAASSDEERWLNAIESGKLEEVDDELKKIKPKDPKLMTARQRAMFERKTDSSASSPAEQLFALPSGYREKVMTPEALQKKALKSQKRKQQADEKREKDKKKTMERLLKKQDSKSLKQNMAKSKLLSKKTYPCISYRNAIDLITLSVPESTEFPLKPSQRPVPKLQRCGVKGCENQKKYTCSKTQMPLCSLNCYKTNLLQAGPVIVTDLDWHGPNGSSQTSGHGSGILLHCL